MVGILILINLGKNYLTRTNALILIITFLPEIKMVLKRLTTNNITTNKII